MHQGNTDQIGRAAWNGMIDKLQKAVTDFVNEKNRLYIENEEYRNKKIAEYQTKVDELENRGNLPQIGQQQSAEHHPLIDIYKNDIENLKNHESRAASEKFWKEARNFHLDTLNDIIMTKTFNNSYDITYRYLSTNVTKEEWTDIFSSVHSVEKPHTQCISLIGSAIHSAHETELLKLAYKALNAKDTLRTISSIMERSEWGECCLRNPDSCNMPNTKRTPDIAVCVICQSHEDSVSYPILISEILGKKNQAHEMNRGMKATMLPSSHLYLLHVDITGKSLSVMQKCTNLKGTLQEEKLEFHQRLTMLHSAQVMVHLKASRICSKTFVMYCLMA